MQYIHAHIGYVIGAVIGSSSLLTGLVLKFLAAKAPALIQAEESKLISAGMAKLKRPEDQAALKAMLAAIRVRFPDVGSAVFALAADACIREVPALAPYRAALIGLFQAVEQAAAAGLQP